MTAVLLAVTLVWLVRGRTQATSRRRRTQVAKAWRAYRHAQARKAWR